MFKSTQRIFEKRTIRKKKFGKMKIRKFKIRNFEFSGKKQVAINNIRVYKEKAFSFIQVQVLKKDLQKE